MKATTKYEVWILETQPEHLRFDTEAEAQAWVDQFLANDRRVWSPGAVRIIERVEKIARKTSPRRGWSSDLPDANSTAWARRGYGDGDI